MENGNFLNYPKEHGDDGCMKANRKFKETDERAISIVTAIIIIVAITVTIAATVYIYTSGILGGDQDKTPNIAFRKETTPTKRLVIVSTDQSLTWGQFTVVGSSTTHLSTDPVKVGDELVLDMAGGYNNEMSVTHIATNTLIGAWVWV